MTRMWGPTVALALTLGCTAVLDPNRHQGGQLADGGASDGGASDGSTDAGQRDGGQDCDSGFRCVPSPIGWSGPVVLISGPGDANAPACPSFAPSTAFEGRSGLTAPPASCECSCEPPPASALSCSPVSVDTASNCFLVGDRGHSVAMHECTSVSPLPSSGKWRASSSTFSTTANCTAMATEEVEPLTWMASHRGCDLGEPTVCGDGVCTPPLQAGQQLCVYAEGDAECPPGFPDMRWIAEDVTDERGCSECTCGAVEGECTGHVTVANTCGSFPTAYRQIPVGGCTDAAAYPSPVALHGGFSPTAACPPTEVLPTGEITPVGVRTVCCIPD